MGNPTFGLIVARKPTDGRNAAVMSNGENCMSSVAATKEALMNTWTRHSPSWVMTYASAPDERPKNAGPAIS